MISKSIPLDQSFFEEIDFCYVEIAYKLQQLKIYLNDLEILDYNSENIRALYKKNFKVIIEKKYLYFLAETEKIYSLKDYRPSEFEKMLILNCFNLLDRFFCKVFLSEDEYFCKKGTHLLKFDKNLDENLFIKIDFIFSNIKKCLYECDIEIDFSNLKFEEVSRCYCDFLTFFIKFILSDYYSQAKFKLNLEYSETKKIINCCMTIINS
jgi:hypothetical protein